MRMLVTCLAESYGTTIAVTSKIEREVLGTMEEFARRWSDLDAAERPSLHREQHAAQLLAWQHDDWHHWKTLGLDSGGLVWLARHGQWVAGNYDTLALQWDQIQADPAPPSPRG